MKSATMTLAIPSQTNWATPDAWATHRELITRLYWDEDKPLKDVQEIMIQDHGFQATYVLTDQAVSRYGGPIDGMLTLLMQGSNVQKPVQDLGVDQASEDPRG